jgi:prepilin peptidase CpaA
MDSLLVALLMTALAAAAYTDLRSSRIPNVLTLSAMGIGLIAHGCFSGFEGMLFALEGLAVGLGLFFVLYLSGGLAAGDVKLMGAVGAIVGPQGALATVFLTIMIGGVYAVSAMSYQWGIRATARKLIYATHGAFLHGPEEWSKELGLPFRLRYGLAITGGTLLYTLGVHPFGE